MMPPKDFDPVCYEWDGVRLCDYGWAQYLRLSNVAQFRYRLKKYGPDNVRTYMATEELRQCGYKTMTLKNTGRKRNVPPDAELELVHDNTNSSIQGIMALLAHLIEDSKQNVITGNSESENSARFLRNQDGLLQLYLEHVPGINVVQALRALDKFVLENHNVKII